MTNEQQDADDEVRQLLFLVIERRQQLVHLLLRRGLLLLVLERALLPLELQVAKVWRRRWVRSEERRVQRRRGSRGRVVDGGDRFGV